MNTLRDYLHETLNGYPKLNITPAMTLKDIENIGEGSYVIDCLPSIELMSSFPMIFDCKGEVGIDCLDGIWIMTISKNEYINTSGELFGYMTHNCFMFSSHSHPANGNHSRFPSIADLNFYGHTVFYIITDIGFLEVDTTKTGDMSDLENKFQTFLKTLPLTDYVDYINEKFYEYMNIKTRRIPYNDISEIKRIIESSMDKRINFWNKPYKKVPYPIIESKNKRA